MATRPPNAGCGCAGGSGSRPSSNPHGNGSIQGGTQYSETLIREFDSSYLFSSLPMPFHLMAEVDELVPHALYCGYRGRKRADLGCGPRGPIEVGAASQRRSKVHCVLLAAVHGFEYANSLGSLGINPTLDRHCAAHAVYPRICPSWGATPRWWGRGTVSQSDGCRFLCSKARSACPFNMKEELVEAGRKNSEQVMTEPGNGDSLEDLTDRMRMLRGLLRKRGMSITKLAKAIYSERTHVGQVLRGAPGRGGHTRSKLAKLLTKEELSVLGWQPDVARVACSTGNSADDHEGEIHLCPI